MYCNEYNTSNDTIERNDRTTEATFQYKPTSSAHNFEQLLNQCFTELWRSSTEVLGRYVKTKVQESQRIVGELHTGPFFAPYWLADHNWQPAGGPVQAHTHWRSCADGNQGLLKAFCNS